MGFQPTISNFLKFVLFSAPNDSAANKGMLTVNYRQSSDFDHPYLSGKDPCDWWFFQEIIFIIIIIS